MEKYDVEAIYDHTEKLLFLLREGEVSSWGEARKYVDSNEVDWLGILKNVDQLNLLRSILTVSYSSRENLKTSNITLWHVIKLVSIEDTVDYNLLCKLNNDTFENLEWALAAKYLTTRQFAFLIREPEFLDRLPEQDWAEFVIAGIKSVRTTAESSFSMHAFFEKNTPNDRYYFDGWRLSKLPLSLLLLMIKRERYTFGIASGRLPGVVTIKLDKINLPWVRVFAYTYLEINPYNKSIFINQALQNFHKEVKGSRATHVKSRESDKILNAIIQYFKNYRAPVGSLVASTTTLYDENIYFLQEKILELNQYYNGESGTAKKDYHQKPKMQAIERLFSAFISSALPTCFGNYKDELIFLDKWMRPVSNKEQLGFSSSFCRFDFNQKNRYTASSEINNTNTVHTPIPEDPFCSL